jgi:hypothetical protein
VSGSEDEWACLPAGDARVAFRLDADEHETRIDFPRRE